MSDLIKGWLWILSIGLDLFFLSQSFADSGNLLETDCLGPFCISPALAPASFTSTRLLLPRPCPHATSTLLWCLWTCCVLSSGAHPEKRLQILHLSLLFPIPLHPHCHNTSSPMSISAWHLSPLEQSFVRMTIWLIPVSHNTW